ncbi:MAG: hypothetical protein H4O13_04540 [Xanthomonadales bacterium]|nr:hypothetical protein [Xanthomonadales bacterium]
MSSSRLKSACTSAPSAGAALAALWALSIGLVLSPFLRAAEPPVAPVSWVPEPVADAGLLGLQVAAEFGPGGQLHALYLDETRRPAGPYRLVYARRGLLAWHKETVAELQALPSDGRKALALAVDAQRRPHVVWVDAGSSFAGVADDVLVHAVREVSGQWTRSEVAQAADAPALAIAPDGRPQIAWRDAQTRAVMLAQLSASGWQSEATSASTPRPWLGLAIDVSGQPRIFFTEGQNPERVQRARRSTAGAWSFSQVSEGLTGTAIGSLALAQTGGGSHALVYTEAPANTASAAVRRLLAVRYDVAGATESRSVLETLALPAGRFDSLNVDAAALENDGRLHVLRFRYDAQASTTRVDLLSQGVSGAISSQNYLPNNAPNGPKALAVMPTGAQLRVLQTRVETGDIDEVRFGPRWQSFDAGSLDGSPADGNGIAMTTDGRGEPEVAFVDNGVLWLRRWSDGQPVDLDLAGVVRVPDMSLGAGPDVQRTLAYLEDAPAQPSRLHLLTREQPGQWQTLALGEAAHPRAFHFQNNARLVLFRSLVSGRIRAWSRTPDGATQLLDHPGGSFGPGTGIGLSAEAWHDPQSGDTLVYIGYFDPGQGALRVVRLRSEGGAWRFERDEIAVDGALQPSPVSDIAIDLRAEPQLQWTHAVAGGTQLRRSALRGQAWTEVNNDLFTVSAEVVELELGFRDGLSSQARLVWIERRPNAEEHLRVRTRNDLVSSPVVEGFGALPSGGCLACNPPQQRRFAYSALGDERLLWRDAGSEGRGLRMARLFSTGLSTPPPIDSPIRDMQADPRGNRFAALWQSILCCRCNPWGCEGENGWCQRNGGGLGTRGSETPLNDRLRNHFAQSEAGRYYLDLWRLHGPEVIALTLRSPQRMYQRMRTYNDFLPGLQALVEGRGHEYRMDTRMVTAAREVWLGWAEDGSPALRQRVQSELVRLNQMNGFIGRDFASWFDSLTPGPEVPLFMDGFEDLPR